MLLTTPNNRLWRWIGIVLAIPLISSYLWYKKQMPPRGGTTWGLIYGAVGSLLIIFLLFQAVRKRWHRCPLGKNESWVNAHIYAGLLATLLIFFHAGFRFHDEMATTATLLLSVVSLSGMFGAVFYTFLPQRMNVGKNKRSAAEESQAMNELAETIKKRAGGKSPPFRTACQTVLDENRAAGWWRFFVFESKTGGVSERLVRQVHAIPENEQPAWEEVWSLAQQWQEIHRRFQRRRQIKKWLEIWLYFHIPCSIAMVVAIGLHLFFVAYY